jgi:hypothetical protein
LYKKVRDNFPDEEEFSLFGDDGIIEASDQSLSSVFDFRGEHKLRMEPNKDYDDDVGLNDSNDGVDERLSWDDPPPFEASRYEREVPIPYKGLSNQGATCYLNSLVQVLSCSQC